jgi:hypothetical protein
MERVLGHLHRVIQSIGDRECGAGDVVDSSVTSLTAPKSDEHNNHTPEKIQSLMVRMHGAQAAIPAGDIWLEIVISLFPDTGLFGCDRVGVTGNQQNADEQNQILPPHTTECFHHG